MNTSPDFLDPASISDESIRTWVAELTDFTPAQVQAVVEEMRHSSLT